MFEKSARASPARLLRPAHRRRPNLLGTLDEIIRSVSVEALDQPGKLSAAALGHARRRRLDRHERCISEFAIVPVSQRRAHFPDRDANAVRPFAYELRSISGRRARGRRIGALGGDRRHAGANQHRRSHGSPQELHTTPLPASFCERKTSAGWLLYSSMPNRTGCNSQHRRNHLRPAFSPPAYAINQSL